MDFEQIKTGRDNITEIDDEVIDRIAKVIAFQDSEMNNLLYQHHKKLLEYAKSKNDSNEVGFFWDLNHYEKEPLKIKGQKNGFNMNENIDVKALVDSVHIMSVVVMHNHPRNGLFSSKDINTFADYDSIFMMTAVCNDGTIYMLKKEENFSPQALKKYYEEGAKLSEELCTKEQIRKAIKKGIDIKNPCNKELIENISTKPYYCGIKNVARHAKDIGITYRCSISRKGGR